MGNPQQCRFLIDKIEEKETIESGGKRCERHTVYHPFCSTVRQHIEFENMLGSKCEAVMLVLIPQSFALEKPRGIPGGTISVPANKYVFMVSDQSYEQTKKAYGKIEGGAYQVVDLSDVQVDPNIHFPLYLREPYQQYPRALLQQARQHTSENEMALQLRDLTKEKVALRLVESLLTTEGVQEWGNLPKKTLNVLFRKLDGESPFIMYFMCGGKNMRYGRAETLGIYLRPFLTAIEYDHKAAPNGVLSMFASWVYHSTHLWSVRYQEGLSTVKSRAGHTYFRFNASPRAQSEWYNITTQL